MRNRLRWCTSHISRAALAALDNTTAESLVRQTLKLLGEVRDVLSTKASSRPTHLLGRREGFGTLSPPSRAGLVYRSCPGFPSL
jgi:hypothetical protein